MKNQIKKVALISGSSRGIGRAIAQLLAQQDYTIYINGRDEDQVFQCIREIENAGGIAKPAVGDFTDSAQITETLKKLNDTEKRLDLVVANLGSGRSLLGWNCPQEEFQRVFKLNFFSAVDLCTQSIPYLQNQTAGNLILIASIAGSESIGAPIAYSSAKSALLSYMKTLSIELASMNIRVNAVSPGNTLFPGGTWAEKMAKNPEKTLEYIQKNVPLNRFAAPEDIAQAVAYLLEADFVTGHNLVVDGGQLCRFL